MRPRASLFGAATAALALAMRPDLAGAEDCFLDHRYLHHETDRGAYGAEACEGTFGERFLHFQFGDDPDVFLALGGEVRQRFETYSALEFGEGAAEDGVHLARYTAIADLRVPGGFRGFASLRYGTEDVRDGPPRLSDDAGVEFQELFVQAPYDALGGSFFVRVGRQEISFPQAPPSRLLSARDGPNVRRSWDGAVVQFQNAGGVRFTAFGADEVGLSDGGFDDGESDVRFWGLNLQAPVGSGLALNPFLYLLRDGSATFADAAGRQEVATAGARLVGSPSSLPALRLDAEAAFQVGETGDAEQRAWMVSADAQYAVQGTAFTPFARFYAASGDRTPGDGRTQTFDTLFQSGAYANDVGLLGGANLTTVGAGMLWTPTNRVRLIARYDHYWRTSRADAVYGLQERVLRAAGPDDPREVGGYLGLTARYTLRPGVHFEAILGHFRPEGAIAATGESDGVSFLRLDTRIRF